MARWLLSRDVLLAAFEVTTLDLAEVALPLFDEPHPPRMRRYVGRHTQQWSETVDRLDAFIIVTPEYNHGYPAALKNALDYLYHEWVAKPVAFVAYGGASGGSFCVEQLRQVVDTIGMRPVPTALTVVRFRNRIDDQGALRLEAEHEHALVRLLEEMVLKLGEPGASQAVV